MYLDSTILIKLVVREPDSGFYADLTAGRTDVRSSELAVAECRSALVRKRQEGQLDAATCARAWERLETMWTGGGLTLDPVTLPVLREAGDLVERCAPKTPIRTLDAIHLASCRRARAFPLITNDRVMCAAAEMLGIPLGPLAG